MPEDQKSKSEPVTMVREQMVEALRLLDEYELSLIAGCHLQAAIDELDAATERHAQNLARSISNDS